MSVTANIEAIEIMRRFRRIRDRGGHAAIEFNAGELALICADPDERGTVSATYKQSRGPGWVRLMEC